MMKDVYKDFPLLGRHQNESLVYFDSAATSHKPQTVIDAVDSFYTEYNSNIHRGVYALSERATAAYEGVRKRVAQFMGAEQREIVFTKSATEAFNLLANTMETTINCGDEILLTEMEHHANIVPWYLLAQRTGAVLRVVPVTEEGGVDLTSLVSMLSEKTKILAITHASNVLGTVNPIRDIVRSVRAVSSAKLKIIVDGSQAVPHMKVNVKDMDVDAYIWTVHKAFGPTGVGVLYCTYDLLQSLPPYQGGGDMIETVSFEHITFQEAPQRFEAGTPNIAGVIGLGAAIDYIESLGYDQILHHEETLSKELQSGLSTLPSVRIIGSVEERVPVYSFTIDGVHPHDVGSVLDSKNICVRTGQHCAEPLMRRFGIPATTRASLSVYNTVEQVHYFISSLEETIHLLS